MCHPKLWFLKALKDIVQFDLGTLLDREPANSRTNNTKRWGDCERQVLSESHSLPQMGWLIHKFELNVLEEPISSVHRPPNNDEQKTLSFRAKSAMEAAMEKSRNIFTHGKCSASLNF